MAFHDSASVIIMMCIFRCNHHPTCDDGADEEGCFPKKFSLKTLAIIIGAGVAGVIVLGKCIQFLRRPLGLDKGPVIIYGRGGSDSKVGGGVENILRFKEWASK